MKEPENSRFQIDSRHAKFEIVHVRERDIKLYFSSNIAFWQFSLSNQVSVWSSKQRSKSFIALGLVVSEKGKQP